MALSSADVRIVFMEPAGDECCTAFIGTDNFANAAGSGNKDNIVFLFVDINAQLFAEDLKERIKPYRMSAGQTAIVTRLSENRLQGFSQRTKNIRGALKSTVRLNAKRKKD